MKRIFLIVLDSFGIGALPDAAIFGDAGANTLASCAKSKKLEIPNLLRLGLGNIAGVNAVSRTQAPLAAHGRMAEASIGRDTTIGHWNWRVSFPIPHCPPTPRVFPMIS